MHVTAITARHGAFSGELGVVGGARLDLGEQSGSRGRVKPVDESGVGLGVPWRRQDPAGPDHPMLHAFSLHLGQRIVS